VRMALGRRADADPAPGDDGESAALRCSEDWRSGGGVLREACDPRMLSSPAEPTMMRGNLDLGSVRVQPGLVAGDGNSVWRGPALQATRAQVSSALKDSAQTTNRRRRGFAGKAVVGFQVALSTLAGGGGGGVPADPDEPEPH